MSGGIWPIFDEDYYDEVTGGLEDLDDGNLECDVTPTTNDSDLPDEAAGG